MTVLVISNYVSVICDYVFVTCKYMLVMRLNMVIQNIENVHLLPQYEAPLMTRAWSKVKNEAAHYWHGSKLLAAGVRISSRLQWKLLHGDTLTRRERRQCRCTTQDLLRLIPFAVFIIVPFMEFLLPNVSPSTFENKFAAVSTETGFTPVCIDASVQEEKQRKLLC